MSRVLKTLLKEVVENTPFLRKRYFEMVFREQPPACKGIYASFAEAAANPLPRKLVGYDHAEVARRHEARVDKFNPADYPVLFWLAALLPKARSVFDLGGNLGTAWYAYRRYLEYPKDLRWTVCEVPALAAAGRELAQKKGVEQLVFTNRREDASGAEIYLTCGALQYIEEPFDSILSALPALPRHLIIQRVPLGTMATFITLQNNGEWVSPYKVTNRDEFIRGVTALGYELIDSWKINRRLEILLSPEHYAKHFHGMYFRRR